MKRHVALSLTLLLSLVCVGHLFAADFNSAKFLPPDNKILLFVGQDRESIQAYSRELNTVPAGVMFYSSIQTMTGIDEPVDHGAGYQDAGFLLREYPDAPIQIGLYLVGTLSEIVSGKYDDNIKHFGKWMIETRRPIFLRIGYEFDLPENDYQPDEYKQVFRYLVDSWRKQGVGNVAYVWHSYGVVNTDKPFMEWYPGDNYVDWFGVSFFRLYNRDDAAVFAGLAKEYHKPLMIAEASPNLEVPTDGQIRWRRWYQALFDFARKHDARAISYINCDWDNFPMWKGQGWGDSRVENDPYIFEQWIAEIHQDKYLRSSNKVFRELGFN